MSVDSTMKSSDSAYPWPAVVSVAFGTFALVTSEFLPIGLLDTIAETLSVSEGRAGLMVLVPGVLAAISAPALTAAARNMDRRRLLLVLTSLLVASNTIVATAPTFAILLGGRVLLGVTVGGFWAFGVAVARRLVNASHGARATTVVLAGISLGSVLGVPIGTAMGHLLGWRSSFAVTAALALGILVAQAVLLPKLPNERAGGIADLIAISRTRNAVVVFIAGALVAVGHFSAFTYLEPYFVQVLRLSANAVSFAFAAYGLAGVVGTFVGELISRRDARLGLMGVSLAMAVLIVMAVVVGASPWLAIACVVGWGAAFGAAPVCIQIWTFEAAPTQFEAASAAMVTVFQVALACGSLFGGMLVDGSGPRAALVLGASCCCACALHIFAFGRRKSSSTHRERPGRA